MSGANKHSKLVASVLMASLISMYGCSNDTNFKGSASKEELAKKAGASGNAIGAPGSAQGSDSLSPVLPTAAENPLASANLSVIAKSIASNKLVKDSVAVADVTVDSSTLPMGSRFHETTGLLSYQTDIQDIGDPKKFLLGANYAGESFTSEIALSVNAPAVATNSCSYKPEPVIGSLAPVQKWHWTGWNPGAPVVRHYLTYSSPVVADLDGDGAIEVISIPSTSNYNTVNGPLVVLEGKTGTQLWNSMEAINQGAAVSTTPAIIDLDADGYADIIFTAFVGTSTTVKEVVAIDYKTKKVKWRFATGFVCPTACIPAVADIDGDGIPEVVAGNVILKNDGTLKAMLNPAPASATPSTVSIADLDPASPGLELVVNGAQVYRADGVRLWDGGCRGYSAVADIDRDGSQDVVCVGGGKVVTYSKDGTMRWTKDIPVNPLPTPAVTSGGAPNIGNFTGNEDFEIGTAGGDYYIVFDKNGNEVWKQPTADRSSHRTGSTIFDFNGDGKVEVVYNDEQKLRIYDGSTGTILWETENRSGTLWEYPVVANIDDDASVEIIVSSPTLGGVRVFDDPTNLWVGSRRVWNQYSYYPEIVSDNLRAVAAPGTPKQGFRINTQGAVKQANDILLSDLTAIAPLFVDEKAPAAGRQSLSFFVVNQGQAKSSDQLKFELVDELLAPLGTARVADSIEPGTGKMVKIETSDLGEVAGKTFKLRINQDAAGNLLARECVKPNNTVSFTLTGDKRVTVAP